MTSGRLDLESGAVVRALEAARTPVAELRRRRPAMSSLGRRRRPTVSSFGQHSSVEEAPGRAVLRRQGSFSGGAALRRSGTLREGGEVSVGTARRPGAPAEISGGGVKKKLCTVFAARGRSWVCGSSGLGFGRMTRSRARTGARRQKQSRARGEEVEQGTCGRVDGGGRGVGRLAAVKW